jgi:hypothetical protein
MILTPEVIKAMEEERNNLYGRFSKDEHDTLVSLGLQILDVVSSSMDMDIQICMRTEFLSYAIQNELIQIKDGIEYIRSLLLEPSPEILMDKERRNDYYTQHRKLIEMLNRDKPKLSKLSVLK